MRAVVQRVEEARVRVGGETVGEIARGLLVFVAVMKGDSDSDENWMVRKLLKLRIFADADDKMNLAVGAVGGSVLLVSQFTLAAQTDKGTRPSFGLAEDPLIARTAVERMVAALRREVPVETGRFAAHMKVSLVNDGPVTISLDSRA